MKNQKIISTLFLLSVCFTDVIYSQNKKGFVSTNIGASIDAYAPTELYFDADAAYFISNAVGAGLSISHAPYRSIDYTTWSGTTEWRWTHTDKSKSTDILIGPCFAINLKKVIIDIRPELGLELYSESGVIYTTIDHTYGTTYTGFSPASRGSEFVLGGSLGMRVFLTDAIALRFFANYRLYRFNTGIGIAYNFKSKE